MKIEKNVPLPDKTPSGRLWYDWESLEVGDSFFVKGAENAHKVGAATHDAGKRMGKKFIYRSVEGGVRVWRIK